MFIFDLLSKLDKIVLLIYSNMTYLYFTNDKFENYPFMNLNKPLKMCS